MCLENHPDKKLVGVTDEGDKQRIEERFKMIQEAYTVRVCAQHKQLAGQGRGGVEVGICTACRRVKGSRKLQLQMQSRRDG